MNTVIGVILYLVFTGIGALMVGRFIKSGRSDEEKD